MPDPTLGRRRARRPLRRGASPHRGARRPALPRGPDRPVHAGRVADEVAPRARHVVLRDVRARRPRAVLHALPGPVLVPLQQLLRGRRAPLRPRRAWLHHPSRAPTTSGSTAPTSTPACATSSPPSTAARSRSWPPPSSSASTTSSSTRSCCSWTSSTSSRVNPLQPAYAGSPLAPSDPDPLGWVDVEGGLVEVGSPGRRVQLRQRAAAATSSGSSPTGSPTGSSPTASGSSSWPTAATSATSCGSPTAGPGCAPRAGGRRSTGPRSTAPGSSTPCTAPGRSTPACR